MAMGITRDLTFLEFFPTWVATWLWGSEWRPTWSTFGVTIWLWSMSSTCSSLSLARLVAYWGPLHYVVFRWIYFFLVTHVAGVDKRIAADFVNWPWQPIWSLFILPLGMEHWKAEASQAIGSSTALGTWRNYVRPVKQLSRTEVGYTKIWLAPVGQLLHYDIFLKESGLLCCSNPSCLATLISSIACRGHKSQL